MPRDGPRTTVMTDSDFDFDFDVNRGRSASGTRPAEKEEEKRALVDDDGNAPEAPENGRSGNGRGNGRSALRRPSSKRNGRGGSAANGRGATQKERPPLVRREEREERPRRFRGNRDAPPPAPDGDEDWFSLADDELGAEGLDSIPRRDAGPAGPRTPREGRTLARNARRRATGRPDGTGYGDDFETALAHQPQKSEVARRRTAVVYGLRGLLDDGRERLRAGRELLRGGGDRLAALREQLPSSVPGSAPGGDGVPPPPRLPSKIGGRRPRRPQPGQIKKLRLAIILVGLGSLAMTATVFGMMMAVAGDLPNLENEAQYKASQNSEVFDAEGRKIGTLLSNTQRRLVESEEISPYIKQAVVAIEDQRFYEHRGVDFQGIARAVVADVMPGGSTQGASTITQQFVKNALEAQNSRTVFQKLRESALAYHLERQWDKDKILTQYLNTIYFGEGAYGIEVAARTYFGKNHPECLAEGADPCASELAPEEAAMLAGIISAPGAFSPRSNPNDALARRNLVLQKMAEQDVLSTEEFDSAARVALPAPSDIEKPEEDSLSPYFTSWLRQGVVDMYGAGKAFSGGLDIHTTIDLDMQETAESIAYDRLAGIEPTASVVVLDNETGAIKAMVGGNDYREEPFNLATNGQRQPGSAFKPFVLATYLNEGGSSSDIFTSGEQDFIVPNSAGKEHFRVENYEDNYFGTVDVATATKYSDNSVFAQMGIRGPNGRFKNNQGPEKIAENAENMGIRTDVEGIQAITLGAPSIGFTPLEMTYAFNAIATDGERIGSNLDSCPGNKNLDELCPTGITKIVGPDGDVEEKYEAKTQRVLPESIASTTKSLLHGPLSSGGTGEDAQTPGDEWGKTGTTENHGDAWFCGGTDHLTACVWVGHAMNNTPMETEFGGEPVAGGTFPAQIWGSIMTAMEGIYAQRQAERESGEDSDDDSGGYVPSYGGGAPSSGSGSGGGAGGGGQSQAAPAPSGGGGGGAPSGTGGTGL